MSQRDARLVAGAYRVGQTIAHEGALTVSTAYNLNTNDVVGLYVIEASPALQACDTQQLLMPLTQRHTVQSPHVLKIHDWGVDGERLYIASDPPRGTTLRYILDTENVSVARALTLLQQLVMGIKACHEKNIAGLDLRPQYITVESSEGFDRVQIDDICLRPLLYMLSACGVIEQERLPALIALDPRYASPEHLQGGQIGPWSDIYQVGMLLFEVIAGRLPYVGRNDAETREMQCSSPIPQLKQYVYDLPDALQGIIERSLAKAPGQRFASAGELLTALQKVNLPTRTDPRLPSITRVEQARPDSRVTNEMTSVEADITLQATLIEKADQFHAPASNQQRSAKASALAYLAHEQQGAVTQRFALTQKETIVGRSDPKRGYIPDIDLGSLDTRMTVSRQHARIRFEEGFFSIEDLKSRNKTRLNELPLTPLKSEGIQNGDILHFGSVRLKFEIAG